MRQLAAGLSVAVALWCGAASAQVVQGAPPAQAAPRAYIQYERNTTPIRSDWACHASKYCTVPVYRCPVSPPPKVQRPPRRPPCRDCQ